MSGIPYTLAEVKTVIASQLMDSYHRTSTTSTTSTTARAAASRKSETRRETP